MCSRRQLWEDKTLVCLIYHCSPSIQYSSWSLVGAHLVFTELTKHPIGTIPHAEYWDEHDKVQFSGSLFEWRQKKKETNMILDSDNGIKSKGWHVRRCQRKLFFK